MITQSSQIWRCWTVWGRNWVVLILPIAGSITGAGGFRAMNTLQKKHPLRENIQLVMGGLTVSDQIILSRHPGSFFAAQKTADVVKFSTAFFTSSIATGLMTAILISGRILSVQRSALKAGVGGSNRYSSIIEIVVESAIVYSVTLLAFVIILTGPEAPTPQLYVENIHSQIAVRYNFFF
jgi:hypothetical protein